MKMTHILTLALSGASLLLALPVLAFSSNSDAEIDAYQPTSERQAQDALPTSPDILWMTLAKAKITYSDQEPHISAKISPEIKVLDGKTITVSGFVLPIDAQEKTSHFLLSKRTPTCAFCPPGEPNEVIEVFTKHAIPWKDDLTTVKGTFRLINNTEQGIFFVLRDGEALSSKGENAFSLMGEELRW